ncbi:MAG: helix-turn-helix transcriptional regulator [Firmicutes bacterium]|nr:helix-turn-helix transcriptional regulator [Bacillota bacterium]
MSMGTKISRYRKEHGLTQESLARMLNVTNQAVSKWETDQCFPDTMLLPALADALGISLDALFGREEKQGSGEGRQTVSELPWENDDAFHVVLYCGHTLIGENPAEERVTFCYEGPAKDLYCRLNLECGDVSGDVKAGGYVECDDVGGGVASGGYVECGDVSGDVKAGGYVECGDVDGNVVAGTQAECGRVGESRKDRSQTKVSIDMNASEFASMGKDIEKMVEDALSAFRFGKKQEDGQ